MVNIRPGSLLCPQFRSKLYDIRADECYPIMPSILCQGPADPIRGLEPCQDSDPDSDSETPHLQHDMPACTPPHLPPPDILTTPPVVIPDPPIDTPPPAAEAPLMLDNCLDLGRPQRTSHRPAWMRSGDYKL